MADSKHADTKHEGDDAHHGMGRYITVYLILLMFTGLTVWTGRMDLGGANIYVAMGIAITKATLVVLFFMHLWDGGRVNRMVFGCSVLFVVVLLLGIFGDIMFRNKISLPPHSAPVDPSALKHSSAAHGGGHAPAAEPHHE